ncbi:Hypothetical protein SMAX5B_018186, partial [Scophthalmus maximus]
RKCRTGSGAPQSAFSNDIPSPGQQFPSLIENVLGQAKAKVLLHGLPKLLPRCLQKLQPSCHHNEHDPEHSPLSLYVSSRWVNSYLFG